jgi:hypothetical protein
LFDLQVLNGDTWEKIEFNCLKYQLMGLLPETWPSSQFDQMVSDLIQLHSHQFPYEALTLKEIQENHFPNGSASKRTYQRHALRKKKDQLNFLIYLLTKSIGFHGKDDLSEFVEQAEKELEIIKGGLNLRPP